MKKLFILFLALSLASISVLANEAVVPITPVHDGTWCNGADINHDGRVDMTDLGIMSIWYGNYGRVDCNGANHWCNQSDRNKDGIVDMSDYIIISNYYNEYGRTDCNNCVLKPKCIVHGRICQPVCTAWKRDGNCNYWKNVCKDTGVCLMTRTIKSCSNA